MAILDLFLTQAKQRVVIPALEDDFTLSSWIYLGAFLQSILFLLYPYRVVVLPSVLVILYRVSRTYLMQYGWIRDPLSSKSVPGRNIAQVINPDGSIPNKLADTQMVVFILASCYNTTAKGRMRDDDRSEISTLFMDMWTEVSEDGEKWGFLGKTSTMYASDEPNTNVTAWISYWQSLEDLQAFARGSTHMAGLTWWSKKKRPHIGLMHETYVVPAGRWENMYINMRPFGLGGSQQPFTTNIGEKGLTNGMIPSRGSAHSSLKARMGYSEEKTFDANFYDEHD